MKAFITGITGQDGAYLAELLLEKEVIFKEDLLNLFGPRPWDTTSTTEKKDEPKQVGDANNK